MSLINDILSTDTDFEQLTYTGNLVLIRVRAVGTNENGKEDILDENNRPMASYIGLIQGFAEQDDLGGFPVSGVGNPLPLEITQLYFRAMVQMQSAIFVPLTFVDEKLESLISSGAGITDPLITVYKGVKWDIAIFPTRDNIVGKNLTELYLQYIVGGATDRDTFQQFLTKLLNVKEGDVLPLRIYYGAVSVNGSINIQRHALLLNTVSFLVPYVSSLVLKTEEGNLVFAKSGQPFYTDWTGKIEIEK